MGKLLSLSADNIYLLFFRSFILSIFLKGCIIKNIMANEDTAPTKASQQETKTQHKGRPNHLINEKSPYLLQHAYNPVDWYPWGEEAFQKAAREDKPIFLSIGYSTCHWCHVMEHESFEDEEVARILNENFISIKVDREERPDIDNIYMTVCQAMTGKGRLALKSFPDAGKENHSMQELISQKGTVRESRFIAILNQISSLWKTNKESVLTSSEQVVKVLQTDSETTTSETLTQDTLKHAYEQLMGNYDNIYGGFGTSPKFPTPP